MKTWLIHPIRIWFHGATQPKTTVRSLSQSHDKLKTIFFSVFWFSMCYTLTAFLFHLGGRLPAVEPWMPIPAGDYYFYQIFFTLPWALGTWILMSGVAHLMALIMKNDPDKYRFENALIVIGLAWVIPSFYLMWIPETVLGVIPLVSSVEQIEIPFMVELFRLMIIPPLWQTIITAVGLRETHGVSWFWGIVIGIVTTGLSFAMFLAFMR